MMTSKRPSLHSLLFIINGISKCSLLRISISPEKKPPFQNHGLKLSRETI